MIVTEDSVVVCNVTLPLSILTSLYPIIQKGLLVDRLTHDQIEAIEVVACGIVREHRDKVMKLLEEKGVMIRHECARQDQRKIDW